MHCPICSREMRSGTATEGSLLVRWLDDEDADSESFILPRRWLSPCGKLYYCPDCGVLAQYATEQKNPFQSVSDKLKDLTDKAAEETKKNAEERREKQEQKAREKRRKKDPWEE